LAERGLTTDADRLARPCVLMRDSGPADCLAGIWGGPGIVPALSGPFRHWLSIDCRFLPPGLSPIFGILSVYTNEDDCVSGFVGYDPVASLAATAGRALYAHPAKSLPPPNALCAEDNESYIRLWQSNCPMYTGEAAAVLGGWHFPWPDGDWGDLQEQPLVVWTLYESEPWVEVWGRPGAFRVMQRIT
jgi:hypothetical protein